jgi:hypothetical protein
LPGALHKPALAEEFGDAAVARVLFPEEVLLVDPRREASRADDLNAPRILPDEDRAPVPVVAMADGVKHGLTHCTFIEGRHVPDEEPMLELLRSLRRLTSRQISSSTGKALPELPPVGGQALGVVRPVFEITSACPSRRPSASRVPSRRRAAPGEAAANKEFGIREQAFGRSQLDVLPGRLLLPQLAQEMMAAGSRSVSRASRHISAEKSGPVSA